MKKKNESVALDKIQPMSVFIFGKFTFTSQLLIIIKSDFKPVLFSFWVSNSSS